MLKKIKQLKYALVAIILFNAKLIFALHVVNPGPMRSTLSNISKQVSAAIIRAEQLFIDNNGDALSSAESQGSDDYLQTIEIQTDYKVRFKFADSAPSTSSGTSGTIPVYDDLLGKKIILIPIYESGDQQITSWECVTNIDEDIIPFKGAATPATNMTSIITKYTENKYLGGCRYLVNDPNFDDGVSGGLWPDS